MTIAADAVEGSMLNDNVISGQTSLTVSSASDIASSDELLISDAGAIKRVAMSGIKTFIGNGLAAVNGIGDADATLAVGVNAPTDVATQNRTWTLPASAGLTVGESVVIKAYANAGDNPITIAGDGDQTIDDESTSQIVLESDSAAITLYYVDTDFWIII